VMARADPEFPGEGQILGLHVVPSSWGQGIGSALHNDALTVLRTRGHVAAGLWVIEANERARGMYERRGWVLRPGMTKPAHGPAEVRYRRSLGALM
jgi:GNAT superfamily N-acetyltransferase